jgi:hypothetical protein
MIENFVEIPLHPYGVYMLVWRGRVVYVGQSISVLGRIAKHRSNYERFLKGKPIPTSGSPNEWRVIKFDKALVHFCQRADLDRLERELIMTHKPELNIMLRNRSPIKIDLGALGFDGDKFREPIVKDIYRRPAWARPRPPPPEFHSPFNKFKPKFPRPRLVA